MFGLCGCGRMKTGDSISSNFNVLKKSRALVVRCGQFNSLFFTIWSLSGKMSLDKCSTYLFYTPHALKNDLISVLSARKTAVMVAPTFSEAAAKQPGISIWPRPSISLRMKSHLDSSRVTLAWRRRFSILSMSVTCWGLFLEKWKRSLYKPDTSFIGFPVEKYSTPIAT